MGGSAGGGRGRAAGEFQELEERGGGWSRPEPRLGAGAEPPPRRGPAVAAAAAALAFVRPPGADSRGAGEEPTVPGRGRGWRSARHGHQGSGYV